MTHIDLFTGINTKTCNRCQATLPLDDFSPHKMGKHGRAPRCKKCLAELARITLATPEGKEARKRVRKTYNMSELGKIRRAAWYQSEARKVSRKSYWLSPRAKELYREYRRTPAGKESKARRDAERRTRLSLAVRDLTVTQWDEIKQAQGGKCAECRIPAELTRDHIIPLSKGGQHTAKNIQGLCGPCNSRKGNRR